MAAQFALAAALIAGAIGVLLGIGWWRQQRPAVALSLAHGLPAWLTLAGLLLAAGGKSAAYGWAIAAVALALATGTLMLLTRDRRQRQPRSLLWIHLLAAGAAVLALAALAGR